MNFLAIAEGSIAVLFILTMITQVVIPLWNDRPLFPMFNKSRKSMEQSIAELNELEDIERLNKQLVDKLKQRDDRIQHLEEQLKDVEVQKPISTETPDSVEISINNPIKE